MSMRSADPELLASVERLVFAAVGVTSRMLTMTPGASDLTLGQWRALAVLHVGDGPLRLVDVAAAMGMSLPSASRMVSRLTARGMTRSSQDADDRRAMRIVLTDAGAKIVEDVIRHRRRVIAQAIAGTRLPASFAVRLDELTAALIRPLGERVA